MRRAVLALVLGLVLMLVGCAGAEGATSTGASGSQSAPQGSEAPMQEGQQPSQQDAEGAGQTNDDEEVGEMRLSIDGIDVAVEWEDNQAVADLRALASEAPVEVELHMYGGFEQVGPLGVRLTTSDAQMTTAPGDIVLYAGNQISVFYGANSWAYTRLGHITDKSASEMTDLLANGDVSITITVR